MNSTRQSLTSEIAEHLHAAIAQGSEVDPYYTPEMVAAAKKIIELRQTFLTRSGEPDILGSTYAYRRSFGDMMTEAGITGADRTRVSSSLRYHIGNVLRETLSPEEVADLGLVKSSPRETAKKSYDRRAALWRGWNDQDTSPITEPGDVVEMLLAVASMLGRVQVDWTAATPQQRQIAEMASRTIAEAAPTVAR